MATLKEVRGALLTLRNELSGALASDPRCKVHLAAPRSRRLQDAYTEGYWVEVGRLGRGMSVELWLDHFSGLSSPRAWCGLTSGSPKRLSQLLALPPLVSLRKRLISRSGRDVTAKHPYRFKHPLLSPEFDVLVREHYAGERDWLGVFSTYPWPFSQQRRAAIVRDATNLIAMFCGAFAMTPKTGSPTIHTPGPWARPDPRIEKAAVRHVRRYLRKSGYHVRSREREICGYDLHATRNSAELHIEVKGCAGAYRRFFISRTENLASASDSHWRLAVITNALRNPLPPQFLTGGQMRDAFTLQPVQWEGIAASAAR